MATRKTSTSKSRTTSAKNSTGKKVTRSSGKSRATTQSALEKNVASLSTKKTSSKNTSKKPSVKSSTRPKLKDRGVKHSRCANIDLFPVNCMPWRLEPRTGKFNLSWYMCFDHAVDQIERSNLKPRDYKLMCHTSVPLSDPLTGPVRIQRYVRS